MKEYQVCVYCGKVISTPMRSTEAGVEADALHPACEKAFIKDAKELAELNEVSLDEANAIYKDYLASENQAHKEYLAWEIRTLQQ